MAAWRFKALIARSTQALALLSLPGLVSVSLTLQFCLIFSALLVSGWVCRAA
jgi:hypothetical protein